jgi:CBS domain-containing protein
MARTVRVRDRMHPGAVAVAWSDSAEAAFARMRDAGLNAIPVVNDQRRVIGLLEGDATSASWWCNGIWLGSVSVAGLMRRGVFVCRADDALEHALATMDRLEVDRLAVLDEAGQVVGVVGRDDEVDRLTPPGAGLLQLLLSLPPRAAPPRVGRAGRDVGAATRRLISAVDPSLGRRPQGRRLSFRARERGEPPPVRFTHVSKPTFVPTRLGSCPLRCAHPAGHGA